MTDYGEGKTAAQEAHDSVRMLGYTLLYAGVVLAIVGCLLAWWLL